MSSFGSRALSTREWINVLTCQAYVSAGLACVVYKPTAAGWVFGGWMVWLGVASAIYHAREGSLKGLRLDHASMYGTFVALAIYTGTDHPQAWIAMLAGGLLVGWLYAGQPDRLVVVSMTILEPMMVVLGCLAGVFVLYAGVWQVALSAALLVAVGWWVWHRDGQWAHGTWHILTATGIMLLFLGAHG